MTQEKASYERVTVTVQIPKKMAEQINERVEEGVAYNVSDFVRQSLVKNLID